MDWQHVYKDLKQRNWTVLLLLSGFGYFALGQTLTLGIILGGFMTMVNLEIMQHTVRRSFAPNGGARVRKAPLIAKAYLRLLALGAAIYALIRWERVDPVGLAIGLSTVVISITSLGVSRARREKTREAV